MNHQKQPHPPISGANIEAISKALGDTYSGLTGSEIAKFLLDVNIPDIDSTNTKWRRLYNAFVDFQNTRQTSNNMLTFINRAMNPARFVGRREEYEDLRNSLNKSLSFIGLELGDTGKFKKVSYSKTLSEAEERANRLKSKLEIRNAHPLIYKYCKAELLAENYFHTVFEAVKSIAQVIRDKTNLQDDGALLVDKAFSINAPLIKINDLQTETDESEHKGFANLIKGVFGMFRNTTAHVPKVIWNIKEEDALDILCTISLIHRKLENYIEK